MHYACHLFHHCFMYISYQELMEVFDDLFDETRIDQWNNLAQVRMIFHQ